MFLFPENHSRKAAAFAHPSDSYGVDPLVIGGKDAAERRCLLKQHVVFSLGLKRIDNTHHIPAMANECFDKGPVHVYVCEDRKASSHLPLRTPVNGSGDMAIFWNRDIGRMAAMASDVLFPPLV